jgi:hypothetical protein
MRSPTFGSRGLLTNRSGLAVEDARSTRKSKGVLVGLVLALATAGSVLTSPSFELALPAAAASARCGRQLSRFSNQ